MKYLCLIYHDEKRLDALPASEMNELNAQHLDFNDGLRASGHFVQAEALEPARTAITVRRRDGRTIVTDGPFAESKEMVAGFYLIEAASLEEATAIVARIPSAHLGTIEIRPARQLVVEGRSLRWG